MKIAVGSDHRGDEAVSRLVPLLREWGHEVLAVGPCDGTSRDYPDEAALVGRAVAHGEADRGVLICGSGIGVSIAANKVRGVRAALVCDEHSAAMSRKHNDANVLCMSGDRLDQTTIERCVRAFLETDFEGGRHARRVSKITAIERSEHPGPVGD
jgi:ribose 5-phosphate isomerase B